MCETVQYYERWVNGQGLRVAQMAAGRAPASAPENEDCARTAMTGDRLRLELAPADDYVARLPALHGDALRPIRHVLLHGSMATHDACEFSDVDVAVFVDDTRAYSADEHRAAVLELRRLLHAIFEIDPLMHHGLMFAPASLLCAYDERFLPIDTLARGRALHGGKQLELSPVRPARSTAAQSLAASAVSLRRHVVTGDFLLNDYRLKSFISGALLMPARILAAHGTYVYKRESFAMARELFTAAQWEFIARCEGLRALWKRPPAPLAHRMLPERAHPQLRHAIGRRMAPHLNVTRLSRAMVEGLIAGANRFLETPELAA